MKKKTPEQLQKQVAEDRQEKIVITVREKIFPILKEKNLSIDQTKLICDLLAIAVQQGQFELMKDHKVADLNLLNYISDDYPQSETVREVLNALQDTNMLEGVNALQWMVSKINTVVENENKKRDFSELEIEV